MNRGFAAEIHLCIKIRAIMIRSFAAGADPEAFSVFQQPASVLSHK
jgi:hypothetical protein